MQRRLFLKSAPAVGIAALAGCPGESGDPGESTPSDDSTSSPTPTTQPNTTAEATATQEPAEAEFELQNLSYPDSMERGDEIRISVEIVNIGEKTGETTVEVAIGDVTCSTTITIEPGRRQTVTCSEPLSIGEGTYDVSATESATSASLVGEITVEPLTFDLPWGQLPGPPGGPVMDIAVSPVNDEYLYATTVTAGLYASSDGGESWIQGPEAEHHYREVEVNPHDPQEARTAGATRTVDAGHKWYGGYDDHEDLRFPEQLDSVNDLSFDPSKEGVLYAAAVDGFYRTTDGGLNWNRVELGVETADNIVVKVDTARNSEGVVYAGFYTDATLIKSDDYGRTWEVVVSKDDIPPGRLRGLVVEQSGEVAYAFIDGRGVYRIGDGPPELLGPETDEPLGPYLLSYDGITVSADDERLYFHAFSLARGEDSFDQWESMQLYEYDIVDDQMRTVEVPEKPASVTAHPTEPETLYFGGWSWVWESTDSGETWTALSNKFVDRYLSTVGTNPDRPGTVVPGSICSGGTWTSHDHGQTYSWKRSGLDPFEEKSGDRHYEEHYAMRAAGGGDRFYVTTAAGLLVSEDNGESWRLNTDVPGYETHGLDHYHGLGVDPNDPMRVYIGTGLGRHGQTNENRNPEPPTDHPTRIWRSVNGGETWQEITNGFPSEQRTVVQDFLISSADGDVVYVGTNARDYIAVGRGDDAGTGFGLFRSNNGGEEWERLQTPFSNVHSVTQDAGDPTIIYASTPRGVFRGENGGVQWEQAFSGPTKALLAHPTEPGVVFAGARKYDNYWDLLVSKDGGETWGEGNLTIQIGTEPDARQYDGIDRNADYRGDKGQIMDLAFDESESHLVAATRGASLWRGTVDRLLKNGG
jgi:photosystem II stability/assembly factor-like uncharacterized protein